MPKCLNPECQKDIPEGKRYCNEDCLKQHLKLKREAKAPIEAVLAYIGVTPETVRRNAYEHWRRFIEFIKDRSPAPWREDLRPKLRSWLGVDFRYIDDYLSACLSWKIVELNDGVLKYKGIPNGGSQ